MSGENIVRMETTMQNQTKLLEQQNKTMTELSTAMHDIAKTLAEMRTLQEVDSKRIDKLEADRAWVVRLILGGLIAAVLATLGGV